MADFTIIELTDGDRIAVRNHLLRLSNEDRHLRFFAAMSDYAVEHYAMKVMDLIAGTAFGAVDGNGRLVGLAHASRIFLSGDRVQCEVGFSIDRDERSKGLSKLLMARVLIHCQNNGVEKLCMSCLRENKRMQALAKSFGLTMKIDFDEAYAELKIP
jgi:RimJ/RimL family protein N-acetyltransferase